MQFTKLKKLLGAGVLIIAGVVGFISPAHALLVGGKWDPLFGWPGDTGTSTLGWEGSAEWFVPNGCVVQPDSFYSNSGSCSGMSLNFANVKFYDYSLDPTGDTSFKSSITFGAGSAAVTGINVASGGVAGMYTALSSGATPTGSNFLGINDYSFAIQFIGKDVRLFYAKNNQPLQFLALNNADDDDEECDDDDECVPKPCTFGDSVPGVCGVNDFRGHPATINQFTIAVPEPQTYALMLAGLAAVGFMARRRRRD